MMWRFWAVPVEMADLAQELNRMLDRLQEDFQRLTDFASDLAHELRTPIRALRITPFPKAEPA